MKQNSLVYKESDFQTGDFVNECLKTFDEGVAKIEAEYAVTSKSA